MNTVSFPKLGLEFSMNPVALEIGNLNFTWYGILIASGILLAMLFAFSQAKKYGIISDKLVDVVMGGIVGGIVGARLYYVALKWDDFKDDLPSIIKTWEGGMAIYGGIIGAFLVGVLIARLHKMNVKPVLDIAGLGFLIGQGIGRWGNFVNVEAFGSNTDLPWGMTGDRVIAYLSTPENVESLQKLGVSVNSLDPVHPCFLYESLWCLLGFGLLFWYSKHRRFDGEIFLLYLGWYGLGRTFIEGLRTDSLLIGNIRVSQLLAGLLLVASLMVWGIIRAKIRSAHDDDYLKLYALTDGFVEEVAAYETKIQAKADKKKMGKGSIAGETIETVGEPTVHEDAPDEAVEEPMAQEEDVTTTGEESEEK